jgi:hypothetical protein
MHLAAQSEWDRAKSLKVWWLPRPPAAPESFLKLSDVHFPPETEPETEALCPDDFREARERGAKQCFIHRDEIARRK